ncbi:MAG: LysM peptidoglycan-binding domain-containing M23 family metallopeptidase [Rickettsiales bacterium]|jgi:murein DD-endopeptidase MepM/ murein hydrolase activator NlpD|nr:LysM peptidoglycan-binding domain-containing M23 family metallopeptidase [Rickettsiales bacterium]
MKQIIKTIFLCVFCVAVAGCDLHDKISNLGYDSENVGQGTKNKKTNDAPLVTATRDDYVASAKNSDYVQYSDAGDYSMPVQPAQKKIAPKVVQKPEIDDNATDDVLLVPNRAQPVVAQKKDATPTTSREIVVARGDTLYSLANKHKTPLRDLVDANKLTAPFALSVGQKLKLPTARVHIVQNGETLYSISRQYSVDLHSLATTNKIAAPYSLRVGQKLDLPASVRVFVVKEAPSVKSTEPPVKSDSVKTKTTPVAEQSAVKTKTENKKISSSPSKPLPRVAAQSSMKFTWPVRGKILSGFGYKKNGLYNDGINIGAKSGTAVRAAEGGAVAYVGNELKGMGNLIIIQHANGWLSVYAHLDSMLVRRGVRVARGEKIGTIGKTGKVTEPQLHFEIRKGTKAYDPNKQLK